MDIIKFLEYSPTFKRLIEVKENDSLTLKNFYEAKLYYYLNLNELYQCLETVVEYKIVAPNNFEEFKTGNRQQIQSCFVKIIL